MLKGYTKFYFNTLEGEEKKIYRALYEGFKARRNEIEIFTDSTRYTVNDIVRIAEYVYNDTPAFYYLDTYHASYRKMRHNDGYIYQVLYIYTEEQIQKYDAQIEKGLETFKKKRIREDMTDYEKELAIHDYLVTTITYDEEGRGVKHEPYNIIGALILQKAVCWGIACAFKLLCDYCQIKSFVIIGEKYPKTSDTRHAWNVVKLDRECYHVDVTWDIKEKGSFPFRYEYLNLKDILIQIDHRWNEDFYPVCKAHKYNYYYKNNLFTRKVEDIAPVVAEQLRKGVKCVTFKHSTKLPDKDVILREMEKGCRQVYPRWTDTYYYNINENTHNIYFDISDRK